MGTAPDFQRAHCLGNSSGRGVCLDLADFTVRVSLFLQSTIGFFVWACRPSGFQRCCKLPKVLSCDSKLNANSFFSIHAVKWPESQDAYAKYAFATCNDDVQTFLIIVEKVGKIPIVGGTELRYLQKQALLYLETPVVVTAGQVGRDFMKSN